MWKRFSFYSDLWTLKQNEDWAVVLKIFPWNEEKWIVNELELKAQYDFNEKRCGNLMYLLDYIKTENYLIFVTYLMNAGSLHHIR